MKHDLVISTDPTTKRHTGHCSCDWSSADYSLRTTVRLVHRNHVDGQVDVESLEHQADEFLRRTAQW